MTHSTRQTLGGILLICAGACSTPASPAAPSRPPVIIPPAGPTLITFTEQGTGFSTTDLYDAEDEILQINTQRELIWVADGTRLAGYSVSSHTSFGDAMYWIDGTICSPACAFEIRFGAKDGLRRAYLTVDYGHDNPGTLVDVDVVEGQLVVTPTHSYPPGSPTLSGVVHEETPAGRVVVEGVLIAVGISSGWRSTTTDAQGHYEVRGLFDGGKAVHASKDGYLAVKAIAPIRGDTTLDFLLVRP